MNTILKNTLYFSIIVQIISTIIGLYGLTIEVSDVHKILLSIGGLETIVNIIQFIFYIWYFYNFGAVSHSTFYRYYDWSITTPLMLFTTTLFYDYNNKTDEEKKKTTVTSFWNDNKKPLIFIFLFNALMLVFGYLYEIGSLGLLTSNVIGFMGLLGSFYVQYDSFVKHNSQNLPLFIIMFIVWSLYGVAAMLSPVWKNASYNILDTVSKNFYTIFLTYMIKKNSIQ